MPLEAPNFFLSNAPSCIQIGPLTAEIFASKVTYFKSGLFSKITLR